MHITRYTDYALRVMIFSALKGDELSTIQEIATHYDISKNHLMKVVQQLNTQGYVQALRGKNGGLRLSRSPVDINLGKLFRDTEQDMALVECFNANSDCAISPACELRRILREALQAFITTLDQYTLADIVADHRKPELIQLLRLGSPA